MGYLPLLLCTPAGAHLFRALPRGLQVEALLQELLPQTSGAIPLEDTNAHYFAAKHRSVKREARMLQALSSLEALLPALRGKELERLLAGLDPGDSAKHRRPGLVWSLNHVLPINCTCRIVEVYLLGVVHLNCPPRAQPTPTETDPRTQVEPEQQRQQNQEESQEELEEDEACAELRRLSGIYSVGKILARCMDLPHWLGAATLHQLAGEWSDALDCRLRQFLCCPTRPDLPQRIASLLHSYVPQLEAALLQDGNNDWKPGQSSAAHARVARMVLLLAERGGWSRSQLEALVLACRAELGPAVAAAFFDRTEQLSKQLATAETAWTVRLAGRATAGLTLLLARDRSARLRDTVTELGQAAAGQVHYRPKSWRPHAALFASTSDTGGQRIWEEVLGNIKRRVQAQLSIDLPPRRELTTAELSSSRRMLGLRPGSGPHLPDRDSTRDQKRSVPLYSKHSDLASCRDVLFWTCGHCCSRKNLHLQLLPELKRTLAHLPLRLVVTTRVVLAQYAKVPGAGPVALACPRCVLKELLKAFQRSELQKLARAERVILTKHHRSDADRIGA
eukprot:gb/GEZN01003438.1/.p1 GENE.gb/GEZN01003438.1/~~gb/GEZN01003438.1/.p1  ORF type:complete len:657 (-),score=117.20 gb/GEZN01003438.1/:208-1896(-)